MHFCWPLFQLQPCDVQSVWSLKFEHALGVPLQLVVPHEQPPCAVQVPCVPKFVHAVHVPEHAPKAVPESRMSISTAAAAAKKPRIAIIYPLYYI